MKPKSIHINALIHRRILHYANDKKVTLRVACESIFIKIFGEIKECRTCNGKGRVPDFFECTDKCTECWGSGVVSEKQI